ELHDPMLDVKLVPVYHSGVVLRHKPLIIIVRKAKARASLLVLQGKRVPKILPIPQTRAGLLRLSAVCPLKLLPVSQAWRRGADIFEQNEAISNRINGRGSQFACRPQSLQPLGFALVQHLRRLITLLEDQRDTGGGHKPAGEADQPAFEL